MAAVKVPGATDPQAVLDPWFTAHVSALRNAASGFCRGSAERDDLVQDTFERALRHFAAGKPAPANMRAWLVSILRNVFIDRVRGARSFEPIADVVAPEPAPELEWARYSMADVERALRDLDRDQRAVFELHYLRGMRYAEIASTLRIPGNTVASRLYRARLAIRDALLATTPTEES